jgi:predicted phage tail protein
VAETTAALVLDGMPDAQTVVPSLREAITALRAQLEVVHQQMAEERQRADRAECRAQAAESRRRELNEQLAAEMVEHRQIVGLLTEQLTARQSWWPWRRRS